MKDEFFLLKYKHIYIIIRTKAINDKNFFSHSKYTLQLQSFKYDGICMWYIYLVQQIDFLYLLQNHNHAKTVNSYKLHCF